MGTPFPNPQDGGGAAAEKDEAPPQPGAGQRPSRDRRASAQKRQQDFLATKYLYTPIDLNSVPGPSGIKQCFRTVKSTRRIAVLPKIPGLQASAASSAPSVSSAHTVPPAKRAKRAEPEATSGEASKRHGCKYCNKKFSSPGKLSQHLLSHTGELPFSCDHCDKKFNSKFKLVRHGLIHSETRPFACLNCDKTFHRKDHLVNHERIHSPTKHVYACERESCKKQYTSLLSYKKHAALHSAEEGNLECKICLKTFENQADIVYHLKVHAGSRTIKNETDKKFNCAVCNRKFFTAKDVRRHHVVHTKRRDFLCQFCPQNFGRKDHLVRHVKKAHPDERPHATIPGTSSVAIKTSELLLPSGSDISETDPPGSRVTSKRTASRRVPVGITIRDEPVETFVDEPGVFPYETEEEVATMPSDPTDPTDSPSFLSGSAIVDIKREQIEAESEPDVFPTPAAESELEKYTDPGAYAAILYPTLAAPSYSIVPPQLEMLTGERLPDLEPEDLLGGPTEVSLVEDPGEHDLPSSSQLQIPKPPGRTVLPTFNQAFQNAAQSPKTQHPPK